MSDTRNPHLVPQFYLRYFASDRNLQMDRKLRRIYTFSKRQGKEVYDDVGKDGSRKPPLISKVATHEEFYEPYGKGDVIEQRFNRLESIGKRVIDEILRAKTANALSKKQRSAFSEYLALQYYRTMKYRRFFEKDNQLMVKTILTDPTSDESKAIFADWSEMNEKRYEDMRAAIRVKREAAALLPTTEKHKAIATIDSEEEEFESFVTRHKEMKTLDKELADDVELREHMRASFQDVRQQQNSIIENASWALNHIIESSAWAVGINNSPVPFITSDSPVVTRPAVKPRSDDPQLYGKYLLCELGLVDFLEHPKNYPRYEMFLPLSPEVILCVRAFYRAKIEKPFVMGTHAVFDINLYQALQAHDEVFSMTRNGLERQVQEGMLAEHYNIEIA